MGFIVRLLGCLKKIILGSYEQATLLLIRMTIIIGNDDVYDSQGMNMLCFF